MLYCCRAQYSHTIQHYMYMYVVSWECDFKVFVVFTTLTAAIIRKWTKLPHTLQVLHCLRQGLFVQGDFSLGLLQSERGGREERRGGGRERAREGGSEGMRE